MHSVLHIEPINRPITSPISVGHTDFIFYGEELTDDEENIGNHSSHVRMGYPLKPRDFENASYEFSVGCPLATSDAGSHRSVVPLVKTLEYAPDLTRNSGHVFVETLHYRRSDKTLIPYRSKIRSGMGRDLRINHLPSLNLIRSDITGMPEHVCDPRSHIVTDLLLRDEGFRKKHNEPLRDWLTYELAPKLQRSSVNCLSFGTEDMSNLINRYVRQIYHTSSELTTRSIESIRSVILPEYDLVPRVYTSTDPIIRPMGLFLDAAVDHPYDFKSWGSIQPDTLPMMIYNPLPFQGVCELMDRIPLTDFNVDMVVTPNNEVAYYFEHLAVDRFSVFVDNDLGQYTGKTILAEFFDGEILNQIVNHFVDHHPMITAELQDYLLYSSVKVKLMKTMTDEAAVLLYRGDSAPNDPPLCGVYFDIAVQSLAPMTIIPEPILN